MATTYTDAEIVRIVKEIETCQLDGDAKRSHYADFAEAFPSLYAMANERRVDEDLLKQMLHLRKRLVNNKVSEEDSYKLVGQTLTKKFVDPTFGGEMAGDTEAKGAGHKRTRPES